MAECRTRLVRLSGPGRGARQPHRGTEVQEGPAFVHLPVVVAGGPDDHVAVAVPIDVPSRRNRIAKERPRLIRFGGPPHGRQQRVHRHRVDRAGVLDEQTQASVGALHPHVEGSALGVRRRERAVAQTPRAGREHGLRAALGDLHVRAVHHHLDGELAVSRGTLRHRPALLEPVSAVRPPFEQPVPVQLSAAQALPLRVRPATGGTGRSQRARLRQRGLLVSAAPGHGAQRDLQLAHPDDERCVGLPDDGERHRAVGEDLRAQGVRGVSEPQRAVVVRAELVGTVPKRGLHRGSPPVGGADLAGQVGRKTGRRPGVQGLQAWCRRLAPRRIVGAAPQQQEAGTTDARDAGDPLVREHHDSSPQAKPESTAHRRGDETKEPYWPCQSP